MDDLMDDIIQLNSELFKQIVPLLTREYGINPYCFGDCPNSSFVEFERKKGSNTITFDFSFGGNKMTDVYYWKMPNLTTFKWDTPDSSIIYSLFPEEKITLSKKENLNIAIDPLKLLKPKE